MAINKCVIVANGSINDLDLLKESLLDSDLIICADGGLKYLNEISVDPDIILGDFDSVDTDLVEKFRSKGIAVFDYPTRKEATDSEIAVDLAIDKKPKQVLLLGFLGTRLDHTLTNMHMLKKFDGLGIRAKIVNDKNEIHFVNKKFEISGNIGDHLSIIPITNKIIGINTIGLEYPLNDETLDFCASRGVSNVFSSNKVTIEIEEGEYFLIKSKD